MSFTDQNERQAAEYLLGGLEEPERIQLQQRLFEDDSYFALLLDVENDLMDAYAAGKLSGEDRQRFEACLQGTSEQREKLAFARALQRTGRHVFRAWLPVAAAVVLLAGLSYFAWENRTAKTAPAAPQVASLVLTADNTRGENRRPELAVAPGVQMVELRMVISGPAGAGPLSANVLTGRGAMVWQQANLSPVESRVSVWVPAHLLAAGNHEVELKSGSEPVGFYYFAVRR